MKKLKVFALIVVIVASCNENENSTKSTVQPLQQTQKVAKVNGDNLLTTKERPLRGQKEKSINHAKIVSKYGQQWDFCACVVANDSINQASQNGLNEKQAETLMKRWEVVEQKCKEFLTNPNRTPEERQIHEKKVERCLKRAKSKK